MAKKKEVHVHEGEVAGQEPIDLGEIGNPGPIEKASEFDAKNIDRAAFMNEKVTIIVHPDPSEGSVEVPMVNVNGVNQAFIRGQKISVKRKYVEALARTRITRYEQRVDMNRPDNIKMVDRTAPAYPFSLIHDPNPKGPAWLEAICRQP